MTEAEILSRLTTVFRDVFFDDTLVLTPETTADDVEQWDSANQVLILVVCEQAFGIKFQTAETEGLKNVGELISVIGKKTA